MNFIDREKNSFVSVYKRLPVCFVRGEGNYLWDENGKKYIDFLTGISVCSLGHCNKAVSDVIKNQVDNLLHISNIFYNIPQLDLAEKLIELYGEKAKIFFANSGAEANECAIKLARKCGNKDIRKRFEIISFKNSFHGRTMATLTATGQEKFHDGFEPLLEGFKYAEINNMQSVRENFSEKTIAIMLELIQGEGGVAVLDEKFVKEIADFCKKNDLIFIVDEIQTGLGRTGKMFCYEHFGIKPDVVTLAKALGGGLPLGAVIINEKYKDVLTYGTHGTTFGGNPVACRAALEVIKQLTKERLENVEKIGEYFKTRLLDLKKKHNCIKDVRGKGLMLGVELEAEIPNLVNIALEKGLVINVVQQKILRFLPSFFIERENIKYLIKFLDDVLN